MTEVTNRAITELLSEINGDLKTLHLQINQVTEQTADILKEVKNDFSDTDSTFELGLLHAQTVLAALRNSRSVTLVQTWNRYENNKAIKKINQLKQRMRGRIKEGSS